MSAQEDPKNFDRNAFSRPLFGLKHDSFAIGTFII